MINLSVPSNQKLLLSYIQTYLEHQPAFYSLIRPQEAFLFDSHKKEIKPPILDFGCGDGFFAHTVFHPHKLNVGLDIKTSRISQAKHYNTYQKTAVYDGLKIPFPDDHFNTVISNCVLEHLPQLNQNLQEIYRVLKPGGHFLTTVMTNQWENHLLGGKLFGQPYLNYLKNKQQHLNLYSHSCWRQAITQIGFKVKKTYGYLNPRTSRLLELAHYLSLPSLVTYHLFDRWVPINNWYQPFKIHHRLYQVIQADLNSFPSNTSGNFFALTK